MGRQAHRKNFFTGQRSRSFLPGPSCSALDGHLLHKLRDNEAGAKSPCLTVVSEQPFAHEWIAMDDPIEKKG